MNAYKIMAFLCAAAAGAGLAAFGITEYYRDELEFAEKNPQLIEVYKDTEENFYKDTDEELMEYTMISGLLNGLDDRFTSYTPLKYKAEEEVNNASSTISSGFQIAQDDKTRCILITEVKPDSQAEKMGLQTGDIITAIDGEKVAETGYYDIITKLLGKDGTKMKLGVLRDGETFQIDFIRANNRSESMANENYMIGDNTLYYCLSYFEGAEAANFKTSFKQYSEDYNIENIIIDLRYNSGGLTEGAVDFFDLFSGSGSIVKLVYEKKGTEEIYTTADDIEYNQNVAVLVSDVTYSSGEILAALFQDTGRGIIIGSQTGGKGVFQTRLMLNDWSYTKLVTGYYYVNDLPNYNDIGITPDIVIDMDLDKIGTDEDVQLQKAIEILE